MKSVKPGAKLRAVITLMLAFAALHMNAQLRLEAEAGGAGFLGMTANVDAPVWTSKNDLHAVNIKLGVGALFPGWPEYPTITLKTGISYYFGNWGLSGDLAAFSPNPFVQIKVNTYFDDQVDMIIYPNINYTWHFLNKTYLRFSAGALLAYQRELTSISSQSYDYPLVFQGDVIPGIGISYGGIFRR